jgi:hypothetical protein
MRILKDFLSTLSMGAFVIVLITALVFGSDEQIPLAFLLAILSGVLFVVAIALKEQV